MCLVMGEAGTGKSCILRVVESKYGSGSVLIMAPTGVANGQNIHSACRESERDYQIYHLFE